MLSSAEEKLDRIQKWQESGDETAVGHLVQALLYDGDPALRTSAAAALGRIKPGPARAQAILGLTKGLADESGTVLQKTVESLGRLGGETAAMSIMLILQDRETSELMLAADAAALNRSSSMAAMTPQEKRRNEAWDIQWTAAEALGRVGGPEALGALVGWCERMLLSDVRILNAEEKGELVRIVLSSLFKKIDAGHIFDLTQTLKTQVTMLVWDETASKWAQSVVESPIWTMFQQEVKKRQDEYMRSLNNRDTLFAPADENGGGRNLKDTLFAPMDGSGGTRAAINPNSPIAAQKAELVKGLNEKDALLLPRHISSGPAQARASKKSQTLSREESDKRVEEYMKSLGSGDSLFMPASARPVGGGRNDDTLFGSSAAEHIESPETEEAGVGLFSNKDEVQRKMEDYMKSLGNTDTLFRPAAPPSPPPAAGSGDEDDLFGGEAEAPRAAIPAPQAPVSAPPPRTPPPTAAAPPAAAPSVAPAAAKPQPLKLHIKPRVAPPKARRRGKPGILSRFAQWVRGWFRRS
ncbi:HEAT repeat domain-containing protein [Candidatus Sumerlaeota bacterium]|nr:HEAT repeat domain-containing protein [Candidatus Sumerlaeota bacterium]